ncbi:hypothetical protein CDAR_174471 [Caerostris darwini]|uniref:Uncharacterized protein n=1 Tax=Caerostris darwini TaxID=1538125 RepID=A0AAV4PDB0_9ARAC|nr:hypothetical protein CDAR_174471 [Caerostris darwini]
MDCHKRVWGEGGSSGRSFVNVSYHINVTFALSFRGREYLPSCLQEELFVIRKLFLALNCLFKKRNLFPLIKAEFLLFSYVSVISVTVKHHALICVSKNTIDNPPQKLVLFTELQNRMENPPYILRQPVLSKHVWDEQSISEMLPPSASEPLLNPIPQHLKVNLAKR